MTTNPQSWLRLNVEQLRTFLVVSEELNFRRAADKLHMASSPVSRRIKELESAVGAKLFERDTRHVILTEAGSALLPLARDVVQRFEALRWSVSDSQAADTPSRIGVGFASGAHPSDCRLLLDLLHQRYPGSDIIPEVGTSVGLLPMLRSGYLTCGLVHLPVHDSEISVALIRDDELGIALRSGHPLADRSSVAIHDLVDLPCVLLRQRPEPEAAGLTRTQLGMAGVRHFVYIDCDWASDVANYVASTDGFSVVALNPESPLHRPFEDPRIVILRLEGLRLSLETGLAWLPSRTKADPRLQAVIHELAANRPSALGPVALSSTA